MSIPDDSEEKPLTLRELAALAEDLDRQLAQANSKARGRANHPPGADRAKRSEVSEKDLLAKYGGKKERPVFRDRRSQEFRRVTEIIFGPDGGTQLIFRPSKGRVKGAGKIKAARWTVSLSAVPLSGYDTQRELSRAGLGLWNKEKGEPALAFKAAEQLLACHVEKLQASRVEVRPLNELGERPQIEAAIEQFFKVSERLDRVNDQLIMAQDAIGLVFEALSKELGRKLQKAFDMLRDDNQWPQDIEKLRWHAVDLARELQHPPTKAELRKRYNSKHRHPNGALRESEFSLLLKYAGLVWLKKGVGVRLKRSPT